MKRTRLAVGFGIGLAALVVGAPSALGASTCRTPTLTKTFPSVTGSWNGTAQNQGRATWILRTKLVLVDGCTRGWIRVTPSIKRTAFAVPGGRLSTKVTFRSTKRAGWVKLPSITRNSVMVGLGRPGKAGPIRAGERITHIRVATTLTLTTAAKKRIAVPVGTVTFPVPPPERKKPVKRPPVHRPAPTLPPGMALPAAPALPLANAGFWPDNGLMIRRHTGRAMGPSGPSPLRVRVRDGARETSPPAFPWPRCQIDVSNGGATGCAVSVTS